MIREVRAKSILNRSSIGDYVINPYVGCQHACIYCYAQFYARRWGRTEPWGSYVEVKVNAPELLAREVGRKRAGVVYLSSMTDPYQPVEEEYGITRRLLHILMERDWPVLVQTKSPLVLRDVDILGGFSRAKVGMTVITLDEKIRRAMEPAAPSVYERIQALGELRRAGIETFAFVGPIPPWMELEDMMDLVRELGDLVDVIYFDRLNLKPGLAQRLDGVVRRLTGREDWRSGLGDYYRGLKRSLIPRLEEMGVRYVFVY